MLKINIEILFFFAHYENWILAKLLGVQLLGYLLQIILNICEIIKKKHTQQSCDKQSEFYEQNPLYPSELWLDVIELAQNHWQ